MMMRKLITSLARLALVLAFFALVPATIHAAAISDRSATMEDNGWTWMDGMRIMSQVCIGSIPVCHTVRLSEFSLDSVNATRRRKETSSNVEIIKHTTQKRISIYGFGYR